MRCDALLILALLVHVTLMLALPGEEVLVPAARVERDEKVRAEVPVSQVDLCVLHLLLSRLHRL